MFVIQDTGFVVLQQRSQPRDVTPLFVVSCVVHGRSLCQENDVLRDIVIASFSPAHWRCGQHILRRFTDERHVRLPLSLHLRIAYYTTSPSILEKVGDTIPSFNVCDLPC